MTDTGDILFSERGPLAEVMLNRPKALNSLTLEMIRAFDPRLAAWAVDDAVKAVVVRGEAEKAFCAGGDIRAIWEAGKAGGALTADFFREEYGLNRRIHVFDKPYVALIDGITMGGGVGVSVHGSHRVAGDRTVFAMPETAIGFFPDVGATWVLPRLPGAIGVYMALTGARLKAADCVYAGLATHYVPGARMGEVPDALAAADWSGEAHAAVDAVLAELAGDPGPAPLAEVREAIDRCFSRDSVEAVVAALEREGGAWAEGTLETMRARSPTSMKLALRAVRAGGRQSFDECMTMEYRISQAVMAGHDFFEGVRALIVDKDQAPQWRPARIEDVDDAEIESYFRPLGERDLAFA